MTLSNTEYANIKDSELFRRIKSSDWDGVRILLSTEEGKAMTKESDIYDNLPLHASIGFRAPDDIILSILSSNPEATERHGTDYWLPLHIAAMWGSSAEVMEKIIRTYPQALDDQGEPGIKGRSPRHFAGRFKHLKHLLDKPTSAWIDTVADS